MQINGKDIWQFGDEYIDVDTGQSATEEEQSMFDNIIREQKAVGAERTRQRLQKEKEWHEQYDQLIWEFFEYGELEADRSELEHWNDSWLSYHLGTYFFDRSAGYYFTTLLEEHPNDWEQIIKLDEIKKKFPDHWEQALDNYKNGNHDT